MSVSVIMRCHNEARFIVQAVESVINRTASSRIKEIIIVNDGSTDGSAELIASLAAREPRIRVLTSAATGGHGQQQTLRSAISAAILLHSSTAMTFGRRTSSSVSWRSSTAAAKRASFMATLSISRRRIFPTPYTSRCSVIAPIRAIRCGHIFCMMGRLFPLLSFCGGRR